MTFKNKCVVFTGSLQSMLRKKDKRISQQREIKKIRPSQM